MTTYTACTECGHDHYVPVDREYDVCLIEECGCPFASGTYVVSSTRLTEPTPDPTTLAGAAHFTGMDVLQARADAMYAEESARYCEHGYPDHGDGCPDCDVPSHLPSVLS